MYTWEKTVEGMFILRAGSHLLQPGFHLEKVFRKKYRAAYLIKPFSANNKGGYLTAISACMIAHTKSFLNGA